MCELWLNRLGIKHMQFGAYSLRGSNFNLQTLHLQSNLCMPTLHLPENGFYLLSFNSMWSKNFRHMKCISYFPRKTGFEMLCPIF